jgi:hypothetical protein
VKVIILMLQMAGLIAYPASAQETKNQAGFLIGSEHIPGSTTGHRFAFSFLSLCGQNCVTIMPWTRQITAPSCASRVSKI